MARNFRICGPHDFSSTQDSRTTKLLLDESSRSSQVDNGEFKKLRRQLQRKRDIKTVLCVNLSPLRLFHVGYIVQIRQSALMLAWHEWFSHKGKE